MSRFLSDGMRLSFLSNAPLRGFVAGLLAVVSLTVFASVVLADQPLPDGAKIFPPALGGFHQSGRISVLNKESLRLIDGGPGEPLQGVVAITEYASSDGEKLGVTLSKFENDAAAYSQFTLLRKQLREDSAFPSGQAEKIGTSSAFIRGLGLTFYKGVTVVTVKLETGKQPDQATALARLLAATLDPGEGDVPVLVKHLPNWDEAQRDAVYFVNQGSLLAAIPNQPILNELTFEGGTEAAVANYGPSQLAIVEFTTPQFSVDNDRRTLAKIQELRAQGQPVPTAYRRVGNYSVFVFSAPDEKTASALIDQVKYEQVIQWLGDDPHLEARIERYLAQTTAGVLIAVLKSSGLSLLICLGAGTFFGALLFRHRRAQQAALYSDAGGGTRLNLDELTGTKTAHRLLEPGEQSNSDS
jgi:uncharacterized protein DUF6599